MSGRARLAGMAAALGAALAAGGAGAEPVVVTGATVHPVSGPAVPDGVVVMDGGVIVAVGAANDVTVPAGAERVDAAGLHLWPGLVDARSSLGLTEIGSVRGTRDHTETGQLNPNARAEVALNASSSHLPVTRANGTLLAAVLPYGSMVPGTAAAIALDGWTWEELVRRAPIGLVIQWPGMGKPGPPEEYDDEEKKPERPKWEERVARLDEMVAEARTYGSARTGGPEHRDADARWESLRSVVDGRTPVWIEAATLPQIRAALDWVDRHGFRMVLVDGSSRTVGEAWRIADELAARGVPVVTRANRVPRRMHEPYDTAFAAPGRLRAAGVTVAFGSWNSAHARNLPQDAARAATFGMGRDEAVRALTLGGAEVLGIADRYGSLEPGKSATMILTDRDVLETRMQVVRAWIDGQEVDLESRHTRLWKKWRARPSAAPTD